MPARKNLPEGSSQTRGPPESPWGTEVRLQEESGPPWLQPLLIPGPQTQRSPPSPWAPGAKCAGGCTFSLCKNTAGQLGCGVSMVSLGSASGSSNPSAMLWSLTGGCVSRRAWFCLLTLFFLKTPSSSGLSRSQAHALCHHFLSAAVAPSAGSGLSPSPTQQASAMRPKP